LDLLSWMVFAARTLGQVAQADLGKARVFINGHEKWLSLTFSESAVISFCLLTAMLASVLRASTSIFADEICWASTISA
jgi:hypothetical protein